MVKRVVVLRKNSGVVMGRCFSDKQGVHSGLFGGQVEGREDNGQSIKEAARVVAD